MIERTCDLWDLQYYQEPLNFGTEEQILFERHSLVGKGPDLLPGEGMHCCHALLPGLV